MAKETPLQTVKRLYGGKEKLVAQIVDFARDDDEDKSEASDRLKLLSNAKLLRIARRADEVKALGGREKLAGTLADAEGRSKDADYVARLEKMPAGKLLDKIASAKRRAARAR